MLFLVRSVSQPIISMKLRPAPARTSPLIKYWKHLCAVYCLFPGDATDPDDARDGTTTSTTEANNFTASDIAQDVTLTCETETETGLLGNTMDTFLAVKKSAESHALDLAMKLERLAC